MPAIFAIGKVTLGAAIVECITVLLVQLYNIIATSQSGMFEDTAKYAILLFVSCGTLLFFLVHGLVRENIFEVVAFGGCSILIVLLTVYQLVAIQAYQALYSTSSNISQTEFQLQHPTYPVSFTPVILQLCIVCLCPFFYGALGRKIYLEISWIMLLKFEDDTTLRKVYKYYQGFMTLLKFDTFLTIILLGVVFLFIIGFESVTPGAVSYGRYALPPAFVVTIGANVAAYFGARFELTPITLLYLSWLLVEPVYIFYKLSKITHLGMADADELGVSAVQNGKLSFYWIIGMVGVLTRFAVIIVTFFVWRNFGKGLKKKTDKLPN